MFPIFGISFSFLNISNSPSYPHFVKMSLGIFHSSMVLLITSVSCSCVTFFPSKTHLSWERSSTLSFNKSLLNCSMKLPRLLCLLFFSCFIFFYNPYIFFISTFVIRQSLNLDISKSGFSPRYLSRSAICRYR